MSIKTQTIILADGLFPKNKDIQDILTNAKMIICCDGATKKLLHFGKTPDYIVGDLDSLSEDLKIKLKDRIIHNPDQETNDLTKAVNFCIEKGFKDILIIGATGLREDHTIGNISLLMEYLPIVDKIEMISDYGIFTPINKTTTFQSHKGQQISIFAINQQTVITTHNLKYPLNKQKLDSWWQGTLNEALSKNFSIEIEEGGKVIVYSIR